MLAAWTLLAARRPTRTTRPRPPSCSIARLRRCSSGSACSATPTERWRCRSAPTRRRDRGRRPSRKKRSRDACRHGRPSAASARSRTTSASPRANSNSSFPGSTAACRRAPDTRPTFVDHSAHWMLGTPDVVLIAAGSGRSSRAAARRTFTRLIIDTGPHARRMGARIRLQTGRARDACRVLERCRHRSTTWADGRRGSRQRSCRRDVAFRIPARARIAVDVLYAGTSEAVTDNAETGPVLRHVSGAAGAVSTSTSAARDVGETPASGASSRSSECRDRVLVHSMRPEMQAGRTIARAHSSCVRTVRARSCCG